jgi:hypothetical protein
MPCAKKTVWQRKIGFIFSCPTIFAKGETHGLVSLLLELMYDRVICDVRVLQSCGQRMFDKPYMYDNNIVMISSLVEVRAER